MSSHDEFTPNQYASVIAVSIAEFLTICTTSTAFALIARTKFLWRTPNNLILINMLFADSIAAFFNFPANIYNLAHGENLLLKEGLWCTISGTAGTAGVGASVLFLASLSVERYFVVVKQADVRLKHAIIACCFCWMYSMIVASLGLWPIFAGLRETGSAAYCAVRLDDRRNLPIAITNFCNLYICSNLMMFSYYNIIRVFKESRKELKDLGVATDISTVGSSIVNAEYLKNSAEENSHNAVAKENHAEKEKMVVRKCVTIVAVFLMNTTPYLISNLYEVITNTQPTQLDSFAVFFLQLNCSVNTILIISLDPQWKAAFMDMMEDLKAWIAN